MATRFSIPRSYQGLYDLIVKLTRYLEGHMGAFGLDGKSAEWISNVVKPACQGYITDFNNWLDESERTPKKIMKLRSSRDLLVPLFKQLVAFLIANPNVLNEDLIAMGLPPRVAEKPKPVPVPATVPEAKVQYPAQGVVEIHFRDKESTRKGKPAGVHGVEIAWVILDKQPVDWSELTNSAFDTKTPYQFTFSGQQRGNKLYFALRWENSKGEKGHWSEIYEAVIP